MIDLKQNSGLPITLTDDFHLKFSEPLIQVEPGVRTFEEMIAVLMDEKAVPNPTMAEMYYMYRDVHLPDDEKVIRENNLRYDLTVIPAGMIGEEFNKTVGHYHPLVAGSNLAYPELYEVITGDVLFLIQKIGDNEKELSDIQAIRAKAGDKIIYPPGYGHIIVNIGTTPVVTSNWVAADFDSDYKPVKDMRGMGYYVLADSANGYKFVLNPKYEYVPTIKVSSTAQSGWGFNKEEPMYPAGVQAPESLKFLTNPEILNID